MCNTLKNGAPAADMGYGGVRDKAPSLTRAKGPVVVLE